MSQSVISLYDGWKGDRSSRGWYVGCAGQGGRVLLVHTVLKLLQLIEIVSFNSAHVHTTQQIVLLQHFLKILMVQRKKNELRERRSIALYCQRSAYMRPCALDFRCAEYADLDRRVVRHSDGDRLFKR